MAFFAIRLALLVTVCWVCARGADLTTVTCEGSPCAGDTLHLAFKLSGTPSGTPVRSVGFYRNGEGNAALCAVDRIDPCNPSASCGCTETGGERTYHYNISSANSSQHDGAWTAVLQNNNPADAVRSPVCQVSVNNSCPYLTNDQCPPSMAIGSSLQMSYTRRRQFPSTAGTALRFVVDGNTTVGTVNFATCTANTLPSGCFDRDGHTVYYLNVTTDRSHDGNWTAVVDANPSSDTVQSDGCLVNLYSKSVIDSAIAVVIISAILITAYCVVLIVLLVACPEGKAPQTRNKGIGAIVGAVIVLACVIAMIVFSLTTNKDDIILFSDLYNATIAFVVIGFIAIVLGVVFAIIMLVRSGNQ